MGEIWAAIADRAPAVVAASGERASYRFFEYFTAQIRNPHTRRAYTRVAQELFAWLKAHGEPSPSRRVKFAGLRWYPPVNPMRGRE